MSPLNVVVDGSNLATEGRSLPSLTQLEEAVQAYQEEHPEASIVVVVDATFEHRIEASERSRLKEAELHGEVVSPPAGTIGRGDMFILKIADRQGAVVLSNDSFQEFHGDFPWLFDEGRLVGGKPVTGVGWIFTERTPVRGPKKRTSGRGRAAAGTPAKKLVVSRPDGSAPKVGDVLIPVGATAPRVKVRAYELAKELGVETKVLQAFATSLGMSIGSHASTISSADADRLRMARREKKIRAYELAKELGVDTKELKELASSAKVELASHSSSLTESDADLIRSVHDRTKLIADVAASLDQEPEASGRTSRRRRSSAAKKKAAEPAQTKPAKAPRPKAEPSKRGSAAQRSARQPDGREPQAPKEERGGSRESSNLTNAPLDFVGFLAHHKAGSKLKGTVTTFTSHGAVVDVDLGSGQLFHCYVRTVHLGNPPPQRARDVVKKGEQYSFKVVAIDASRRVAELELA
jgi:hypothetical protein